MSATRKQITLLEYGLRMVRLNSCDTGQAVLTYLRSMMAKGQISDDQIWDNAPEVVKQALYNEAGVRLTKKAEALQEQLRRLKTYQARLVDMKLPDLAKNFDGPIAEIEARLARQMPAKRPRAWVVKKTSYQDPYLKIEWVLVTPKAKAKAKATPKPVAAKAA